MAQKKIIKINNFDLYGKILGFLIKKGNKSLAQFLLEKAFTFVSKKLKKSFLFIFLTISLKLNTYVESKKIRIRKRSYIIPFSLSLKRRFYLSLKWLLKVVKDNNEKISFSKKLAFEILQILNTSKSKTLIYKKINNNEAFLNRSNSHFRW